MKLPTPHAPKLTALEVALLEAYDLETFLAISCTGVDREDSGYASDTLGSGDNLEVPLASTTPRSASNSTFASPATVAHATHTSRGESIPFISYGTYETLPQVEQRTDSGKHRVLPDFGGLYTDEPQALDKRCPTGQQSKSAHREQPVPQPPYERRSNSAAFERQASIECTVNGAGVLLQCVHDNPSELPAAWHIEPVAQPGTVKQKVQIRLNWPGYPPRHRSVNILDFTKSPTPVSKAKFLVSVAKGVKGMMEENARFAPDDASWRIGPGGIEFSHVILLSLEHVAKSSWQPVLSVSSF